MMDTAWWTGKRVLVTGSAGVIGRETLMLLDTLGAHVLSMDREPLSIDPPRQCRHIRIDLAEDDLAELVDFAPQVVIHLAAAFERSKETPGFWPVNWRDNLTCSHRVIDACRHIRELESFVFASSYLVYDPALYLFSAVPTEDVRLGENDRVATRNITGAAKLYAESELAFLREHFNGSLQVVNARIYRVYGRGSKDVISRWVRAALSGEPVTLYNGDNRFDYVFAGDVAEGLVRLAQSDVVGAVNLACGSSHSVREVVREIDALVPGFADSVEDAGVQEAFESSCANVALLRDAVDWTPSTGLASGIALLVEHERERVDSAEART